MEEGILNAPKKSSLEKNYSFFMNHSCDSTAYPYGNFIWLAPRDIHKGKISFLI